MYEMLSPLSAQLVLLRPHPQRACSRLVSAQAHGRVGELAREACTRRRSSASGELSLSVLRAQRCPHASVSCSRFHRRAATAAPREDGEGEDEPDSALHHLPYAVSAPSALLPLLLVSFVAFTALPACASDGTGAAASEARYRPMRTAVPDDSGPFQAIGVLNQVASTLTGLAVAFFGGVAILMQPMKSDVNTVKKDVSTLKTDVGQIKTSLIVSTLLTITGFVCLGVLMVTRSQ
jgi:hypothetical protein